MSREEDGRLRCQLDQLAERGRHALLAASRRRACRTALTWAAPTCPVGAALSLAWALSSGSGPGALVAVAIGIPLATAAGIYAWRAPRGRPDRRAALALFDQRFGLKDRIITADQLNGVQRGAFEEAALMEARPWIERAVSLPLDLPSGLSIRRSRLWWFPLAALALLGLALVVPPGAGLVVATPGSDRPRPRVAVSSPPPGASAVTPSPGLADASGHGTSVAPKDDARRGLAAPTALAGLFQRALSALGLKAGDGAGEAEPSPPRGGTGRNAANAGQARKAEGRGAQGETQDQVASVDDQAGATTSAPAQAAQAQTASQERSSDAEAAKAQPQGGAARQDAPSQRPPPSPNGTQKNQSGEGQQPRPGRGRKGDQNSSGREQGGGEGENGSRSGADPGAKKGRGVASLLLATPMQDRLTGMAAEGRVVTTTREGRPQAFPSKAQTANESSFASGEAGQVRGRADAAHDQRLLRDYFSRRDAKSGN